ncbi:phosphate regulon transcriptional regulator PhoB [Zophobihabitans entericus]|uniref:Phosphate regulon transcriptional regulatory protein PhoB n=1 Tax=Zophobihabitans entericus TaxID=1635327 RepID=A0A6G9ICW5_9GAMM|nr:phosphate regulon transcriptional regulator PhoB [Zophobihabitans entericus]QIQ22063.1 phosphate regulon transcriptional regulatory protein PhoB [Zophobihabitans entericus]
MTKTILVIEDDIAVRSMLKLLLEQHDFTVIEADDYKRALTQLQSATYHLVLLDWMLPGGSGIQIIKYIKQHTDLASIPIIMLTAKQMENDRITGLNVGADDYISKPFSNKELIARIHAVIRRTYPENSSNIIELNGLVLDPDSHRVTSGDTELKLGPTEFKLLTFFMTKPERVFSRDQLIDHIWGQDVYIDDRTIDVHIGRLRKQLEISGHEKMLQTVRGAGYRFSAHQHSIHK